MIYPGLPEDPALLAAIGQIAIRHGQLDYQLKLAAGFLAGVTLRETTLDAMARQGSAELRKRVRKLAAQRMGEGHALLRLDAWLERCRRAAEHRNDLLHSLWAVELDGGPVKFGDDHQPAPCPSVSEIEAVAEEMAQIANELAEARCVGGVLHRALNPKDYAAGGLLSGLLSPGG